MLKVTSKGIEILRDNDTFELHEAESYTLEDGTIVIYEWRSKSWSDLKGRIYIPTPPKGEPEGFIRQEPA